MRQIYLIRHAQSIANVIAGQHWPDGPATIPLSDEGKRRAQLMADHWSFPVPDLLCCSTYTRSIETAIPLAKKFELPLHQLPALRELTFWDYNWTADEYQAKRTEAADYWVRLNPEEKAGGANAESFIECVQRARQFQEWAVKTKFKTCVCVSHGYFMLVFRAVIQNVDLTPKELMKYLHVAAVEDAYANLQIETYSFPSSQERL